VTVLLARADARALPLRDGSVQCCVTSPPFWGLRSYDTGSAKHLELGSEPTPEEYVAHMVEVFREVRRVLRDDGVLWLNLGDCYCGAGYSNHTLEGHGLALREDGGKQKHGSTALNGLKPKDLVGIPWRVAFALQADGWWLRSDIVWHKPNPMPESVTDRPTRAHEYLFLLTKAASYYYDAEAVKEPNSSPWQLAHNLRYAKNYDNQERIDGGQPGNVNSAGKHERPGGIGRNLRSVWTITTQPYKGAHYATFPTKLVEPCIKAGSRVGDVVLDPFCGTATVARVAIAHERLAVCFDISETYLRNLATKRTANVQIQLIS
jgi:DNA modification methylase